MAFSFLVRATLVKRTRSTSQKAEPRFFITDRKMIGGADSQAVQCLLRHDLCLNPLLWPFCLILLLTDGSSCTSLSFPALANRAAAQGPVEGETSSKLTSRVTREGGSMSILGISSSLSVCGEVSFWNSAKMILSATEIALP